MRFAILAASVVVAVAAASAEAAPVVSDPGAAAANVVPVAQGCGRGFHRNQWGHCRPNHPRYYRRWHRGDGSAEYLNRRELRRWGY